VSVAAVAVVATAVTACAAGVPVAGGVPRSGRWWVLLH